MELETVRQLVDNLFWEKFKRHLSDPEVTVLCGAWEGITYGQMAMQSPYSENYLMRDIGPNLFRQLKQALGEEVSKANFRAALERHQVGVNSDFGQSRFHQDWGEAPDNLAFYGREAELATLKQWINEEKCRVITLAGMGGVGKTLLARKLAEDVKSNFRYIIWRALHEGCRVQTLLADLLSSLHNTEIDPNLDLRTGINNLLDSLQRQRCLLVLDNVDAVLKPGPENPLDPEEVENFNTLLKRVGEKQHQSCLILIARDQIPTIEALETAGVTNVLRLQGLEEEAAKLLLADTSLKGEERWDELISQARGIPLVLKLTAQYIEDLFDGDVVQFLDKRTWVFDEYFSQILRQQFDALKPFEREVIQQISASDTPLSLEELRQGLANGPETSFIMKALVKLIRIDWIEKVNYAANNGASNGASNGANPEQQICYQAPFLIKKYVRRQQQPVAA